MNNSNKKKKKANGMGSITERKGRTKPFEVSVTLGYEINEETQKMKRVTRCLGYFATRREAESALNKYNAETIYNKENYTESKFKKSITFAQLYKEWSQKAYRQMKEGTIAGYDAAFKSVASIHNKIFISLVTEDLRQAMIKSNKNYHTLRKTKVLFSRLCAFAIENRLTNYDASLTLKMTDYKEFSKNPDKIERKEFSKEEIKKIMEDTSDFSDTIKFLLYTGVRIGEMTNLLIEDVHIEEYSYFIVKESKTEAGRNRIVPIHDDLKPIVEKWIKKSSEKNIKTLFHSVRNKPFKYDGYRIRNWDYYFAGAKFFHRPHDTRHTFKTYGQASGINRLDLEKIMGHTVERNIESLYYHPTPEMLYKEIMKLKFN